MQIYGGERIACWLLAWWGRAQPQSLVNNTCSQAMRADYYTFFPLSFVHTLFVFVLMNSRRGAVFGRGRFSARAMLRFFALKTSGARERN
jgi:hypothetical protein